MPAVRGVASRVGIAVVDEAVLALLGSAVPDPFEFFYQERPLATANGDTRLRLSAGSRLEAAKFKGEAGGDGAERLAARSLFTTTAYWNPAVETDSQGRLRSTSSCRQLDALSRRGDRSLGQRTLRHRAGRFPRRQTVDDRTGAAAFRADR
jgi:hypothetical protein